jgi:creatinine amidohydrolase
MALLFSTGAPLWAETVVVPPQQGTRRKPIATLHPGDRIVTETLGGSFYSGKGSPPGDVGPIEITGAEVGDTLVVSIERIAPKGVTGVSRGSLVALPPGSPPSALPLEVWRIDPSARIGSPEGGEARVPLRATLGHLRVEAALPSAQRIGAWGGDLEMANLQEGDRVSLPCLVRGALLSFGDGHSLPWQGSGTGLLTSVAVVLKVDLQKHAAVSWPRIENDRTLGILATGQSSSEASRLALEGFSAWMLQDFGLHADAVRALLPSAAVTPGSDGARGSAALLRLPRVALPLKTPPGIRLGDLPWTEAERVLDEKRVVVLPLGAGSKEHGPHLLLKNDEILATSLMERVLRERPVVALPILTYGFYPAFLEYPGSVSLSSPVQRDLVAQICRSIARYGPRRFYVLNTGISTARPLRETAALLEKEGILMRFSDLTHVGKATEDRIREETYGTHADEIETSMLLYLDPDSVRMDRARADGRQEKSGPLTRDPNRADGHYSPSGVFGDPTLATWEKGRQMVEAIVSDIVAEIDALSASPAPSGTPLSPLE